MCAYGTTVAQPATVQFTRRKKIVLNRQAIRELTSEETAQVTGGMKDTMGQCENTSRRGCSTAINYKCTE